MKKNILLFLLLFIVCVNVHSADTGTVAIVSSIDGQASLKSGDTEKPLDLGAELKDGDTVIIGKKSSLTVLFQNGALMIYNKEGVHSISVKDADKRAKTRGIIPEVVKDFNNTFNEEQREETLGKVLSLRPIEDFMLIYPRMKVFSVRPRFLWDVSQEIHERAFIIVIGEVGGRELLRIPVSDICEMDYPSFAPPLTRGNIYYWRIELVSGDDYSDDMSFTVVDENEASNYTVEIDRINKNYKDQNVKDMLIGKLLTGNSLYTEAIEYYNKLAARNPNSIYPHQELAIIYQNTYLKKLYDSEMLKIKELKK